MGTSNWVYQVSTCSKIRTFKPYKMTLKNICLIIFIGWTFKGFSQTKISNVKTENHVLIAGTSSFIILPASFEKATNFIGFQDVVNGASMIVNELPGPFKQLKDGFSKENMLKKGMEFESMEAYEINNSPAVIIKSKQFSATYGYYFLKSTLVFSTGKSKTLVIHANIPEVQKDKLAPLIKASLLSILNDSAISVDRSAQVDFEVDIKGSAFKPNNLLVGALTFEGPKKEFMMIGKSIRKLDPLDKKGSSITAIRAISTLEYLNLVNEKTIMQDGMPGYQVTANIILKENKKPMKLLQAILFSDNYYYAFVAILNPDEQNLIEDFNHIVSSFKRK